MNELVMESGVVRIKSSCATISNVLWTCTVGLVDNTNGKLICFTKKNQQPPKRADFSHGAYITT